MGSPKVVTTLSIVLFFFFFFLVFMSTTTKACSHSFCNQSIIRFPFRLTTDQQPDSCGYPGFELSCDSANQTVLKLPYSGEFSVQSINYYKQQLWLNDPNNCLPQKLLSLNLSGSPFVGKYYEELTFYNCSSLDSFYVISPISCLSDSNYTIYAASSTYMISLLSASCNLIKKISIPVPWPYFNDFWSTALNKDLWLTWDTPNCRACEDGGGRRCGFKSKSSLETTCFNFPSEGVPRKKTRNAITICVGVIMLLGLLCLFFASVKRINGREESSIEFTSTIASQPSITTGLDGATLESYPIVILGESRRLPKPDDETCSICLSAYKPKETLKSIPKCNHCFHADCIDEWLRLNPTCPVCRNSPEKKVPGHPS